MKQNMEEKKVYTIDDMIRRSSVKFKTDPSIKYIDRNDIVSKTYIQLEADCASFSNMLASKGWRQTNIALLGKKSYEWIIAYLGTVCSGNVVVPLDWELESDELGNLIDDSEIKCLVYDLSVQSKIDDIINRCKNIELLICLEKDENNRAKQTEQFYSLLKSFQKNNPVRPLPDEVCAIVYTSGTTGKSKGVMLTHKNIIQDILFWDAYIGLDCSDTCLSILPLHHTYEMTCGILYPIFSGMTVCLNKDLKSFAKNLIVFKPTFMFAVPRIVESLYQSIWNEAKKSKRERKLQTSIKMSNFLRRFGMDFRNQLFMKIRDPFGGQLKRIYCGGAPLSPKIITGFDEIGITVLQGYGITECSPLVALNLENCIKPDSVGMACRYCKVCIRDGEILVKGDIVTSGYYKDAQATQAAFTEDGWFRTGDLGSIDKDGYLYITGRIKNLIITNNGENISPEKMEQKLMDLPCIEEAILYQEQTNGRELIVAEIYPSQSLAGQMNWDHLEAYMQDEINRFNTSHPGYCKIQKLVLRKIPFEKTTSYKIKR